MIEGCPGRTCEACMNLTFDLCERNFQMASSTHYGEWLFQIILKSIHNCRNSGLDRFGPIDEHMHPYTEVTLWQLCQGNQKQAQQKWICDVDV